MPTYIHTDTYVRMYKSKISRPPKTMHIVYPKNTQCGYTCIAIPSYIFDDNVQAQIVCSWTQKPVKPETQPPRPPDAPTRTTKSLNPTVTTTRRNPLVLGWNRSAPGQPRCFPDPATNPLKAARVKVSEGSRFGVLGWWFGGNGLGLVWLILSLGLGIGSQVKRPIAGKHHFYWSINLGWVQDTGIYWSINLLVYSRSWG